MPIAAVKTGTLLERLAKREQTTSDDILNSAVESDPKESKVVGPLTSPEELLEALDLAIGPDGEDAGSHEARESEFISPFGGIADVEVAIPTRKKRRTKKEIEASAAGTLTQEPKFVELTKLFPPLPEKGNFEVNTVKKSLYFFS